MNEHCNGEDGTADYETPAGDDLILEGLRAGEEAAYEELLARYQSPVYNLVYRLLNDPGDASDVVQEVFLKVFRGVGSFRRQSSLKTWVYRIAVNEAHNHRRWYRRKRSQEVGLEEDHGDGWTYGRIIEDPGRSPFDEVLDRETQALVADALSRLKPVFQSAVVLRDIEELSYDEIAEILQVSLGTVKSRILRGREALRADLAGRLDTAQGMTLTPQTVDY